MLFCVAGFSHASETNNFAKTIIKIKKKMKQLDVKSHRRHIKASEISVISETLTKLSTQIEQTQAILLENLTSVMTDIKSLGEKKSTDPRDVKIKHQKLSKTKTQLEGWSKASKFYLLKIKDLQKHLVTQLKRVQSEQLFAQSRPLHSLLWGESKDKKEIFKSLGDFFSSKAKYKSVSFIDLMYSLLIVVAVYLVMFFIRWRMLRSEFLQQGYNAKEGSSLLLIKNIVTYLPGMSVALSCLLILDISGYDQKLYMASRFVSVMFVTLLVLPFLLTAVISFKTAKESIHDRHLNVYMKILVYVTGVGFFVNSLMRESGLEINTLFIMYDFTLLTMLIVYYFSISLFAKNAHYLFASLVRVIVGLFALTLIIIAFKGYRNLSFYLLQIVLGMFVFLIIYSKLNNILSFINTRIIKQVQRFHESSEIIMIKAARFWLVFLLRVILLVSLIYSVLDLLGFHETLEKQLEIWVYKGLSIGSIGIVPSKILLAILVFAGLHSFSGWVKAKLDSKWLSDIGMERSAKEALVTMSGYIGVIIASLVAMGIVGVSFTNLAIIAGALSVGIGFGLQNIVNNFISGLILLFERPIKTGDWIVVGGVEGYVKRISIRSTIIQTFQRADVIVPNAELITTKVTNWMYRDRRGRVDVAVGVAYGSNVQQVIALLSKAAEQQDQVITENPMFPIRVLMLGFGDSALDFELRCFINDIDRRVTVHSELNIAVEIALREAGIEIPFPQRDVHVIEPTITEDSITTAATITEEPTSAEDPVSVEPTSPKS